MKIYEVENRKELINILLEIWEDSVRATHLFLNNEEINNIKKYVPQALIEVSHLIVLENENNIIAFMGITDQNLEMLFVKNNKRGKGFGKKLLNYGIEKYNVKSLTVNEQNPSVLGFYKHLGFIEYKRSNIDNQGNPYPIIYMKKRK